MSQICQAVKGQGNIRLGQIFSGYLTYFNVGATRRTPLYNIHIRYFTNIFQVMRHLLWYKIKNIEWKKGSNQHWSIFIDDIYISWVYNFTLKTIYISRFIYSNLDAFTGSWSGYFVIFKLSSEIFFLTSC